MSFSSAISVHPVSGIKDPVPVQEKGLTWLVYRDGRIATPPHSTTFTRVRKGVEQTFSATFKGGFLSPCLTRNGYLEVAAKKGRRIKATVHRLIGLAFVPGYEPGLHINHINGVKTDNRPENLEWTTNEENVSHAWRTGLVDLRGENQPGHKLTAKQVRYIRRLLREGVSAHSLAIIANVSRSTVGMIRDGKRWRDLHD